MESHHFNGDLSNAELLFRTIFSVNRLSVYGAIADWCGEVAQQISDRAFSSTGKLVAQMNEQLNCRLSPEVVSVMTKPSEINKAGFMRKISPGQYFVTIHDPDGGFGGGAGSCRDYTLRDDEDSVLGRIRGHTKIGPVRQIKVTYHLGQCGIEIQILNH